MQQGRKYQNGLGILLPVTMCVLAMAVAGIAQSVAPYRVRMAVKPPPPPSEVVLVRFSTTDPDCAGVKAFRAEDGAGTVLPSRVVWTSSNAVYVLVHTGGIVNRSEFYLCGVDPAKAQVDSPVWTNVLMSVGVTVRQRGSPSLPNTWDRFLYFWERSAGGTTTGVEPDMDMDDFAAMMVRLNEQQPIVASTNAVVPKTWRDRRAQDHGTKAAWREKFGVPAVLMRMDSLVLFPADGDYRLAISCRDSGYLLIDGELVLAVENGATPTAWHIGESRRFSAGTHLVEALTSSLDPVVRVGWSLPGASEVTPIGPGSLLAPGPVLDGRFEVRGRFIHANFSHTVREPYRFRDMPGVFVPVVFTDASRNPGGAVLSRRWQIEGRTLEGPSAAYTFTDAGPYPVRLVLSDSLGATGVCDRVVEVRPRLVQEYAVDFAVGGLPSACFDGDPVNPYLIAWGKGPSGVGYRVAWSFLDTRTNVIAGGETNVTIAGQAVKVDFGKDDAGALMSLAWNVSVAGKVIKGGNVKFDRAPFAAWPESVTADWLCDRTGARTVLLTSLERCGDSYEEPENAPPASGPVILVDDTLVPFAAPGVANETYAGILPRLLEGARDVRYASIAPPEESGGSLKSLTKFVTLPKVAGAGSDRTVVLSTGVHDLLLGDEAESFERGLAVMVDKLLADKAAVVLVTPPPYPGMETRLRAVAVAVRRVADARGLMVADLYTAFMAMRQTGGAFFELDTLGLTARGHRLAADRIARALARDRE